MQSTNTSSARTVADDTDAPATTNDRPPSAEFVTASTIKPEKMAWLWPGYVPLGVPVILDGDPGLGKSTLVADLAARVTNGYAMPCGAPGPDAAGVIICNAEDDPASVTVPRLLAAGADLDRVGFPPMDEAMLLNPAWLERLEDAVRKRDARLVVIDPMFAFVPRGIDTHRDADIRRVLGPVAMMSRRLGATVLLVRHPNKSEGTKALHRGGGSIAIIGAARAALLLARDPAAPATTRRILAVTKLNGGKFGPSRALEVVSDPSGEQPVVRWNGTLDVTADELVQIGAPRPANRREAAEEFLRSVLAAGPVPANDVIELAAEADIKEKTLRRAASNIGVSHSREGFGGGGHHAWSLSTPDGVGKHDDDPSPPDEPATAAEVIRVAARLGYPAIALDEIDVPEGVAGWTRFASPTNTDAPLDAALATLLALESEAVR